MIHSVHSCFHTIYLTFFSLSKFDHSCLFFPQNFSFSSFGTNQTNLIFFFRKINQTQPKDRLVASTNIQVFYLRQQNKGTKTFSVFFTNFFVLYYGGDLISNNLNDKKNLCFFFFGLFFFYFFFRIYFSNLFFFNQIYSFTLLSLFFFLVALGWTVE